MKFPKVCCLQCKKEVATNSIKWHLDQHEADYKPREVPNRKHSKNRNSISRISCVDCHKEMACNVLKRHFKVCNGINNTKKKDLQICKICDRSYNAHRGLAVHLAMEHDLSFLDYAIKYENIEIPQCACGSSCEYFKGNKFKKHCGKTECRSKASTKSKQDTWTDEKRIQQGEIRSLWLKENPEQNAWRLGNKQSWAEKFFEDAVKRANLDKQYLIIRELHVHPYYIDFAFTDVKVAVEVDGAQHLNEYHRQNDIKKNKLLLSLGWKIFRIPAHHLYSLEDSDKCVSEFIEFLNCKQTFSVVGFKTASEIKQEIKAKLAENKRLDKIKSKQILIEEIEKLDFSISDLTQQVSIILDMKPQYVRKWMSVNMKDFYDSKRSIMKRIQKNKHIL